jgi:hypothetical protein
MKVPNPKKIRSGTNLSREVIPAFVPSFPSVPKSERFEVFPISVHP